MIEDESTYDFSDDSSADNDELGWFVPFNESDQLYFDNEWEFNYEYYRNQFVKSSKFGLGLIGLFDEPISNSSDNVLNYYLLNYTIEPKEILKNPFEMFDAIINDHLIWLQSLNRISYNPFIRNHQYINSLQSQIEIIQRVYYNGYTLVIKKTFWLRLIQRKFKNRYKKKMSFMRKIQNLNYRAINGKWPQEFYHI